MQPDKPPVAPKGKHELGPGVSLSQVLEYAHGLTVERNEKYFPTLDKRVIHLYNGGVEMFDTIRARAKSAEFIPVVASKIFLRALNVLQDLSNRGDVVAKLVEKFPESGCSYCGKKPCECGVIRAEDKVGAVSSPEQSTWSIRDWQEHLKNVYGASNHAKGIEWVTNRLGSEIGEMSEAAVLMEKYETTNAERAQKYKDEAASEAADIVAWIIGVCNESNLDLEMAFQKRYGKGCPNCQQYPCKCGEFSHQQERKVLKNF